MAPRLTPLHSFSGLSVPTDEERHPRDGCAHLPHSTAVAVPRDGPSGAEGGGSPRQAGSSPPGARPRAAAWCPAAGTAPRERRLLLGSHVLSAALRGAGGLSSGGPRFPWARRDTKKTLALPRAERPRSRALAAAVPHVDVPATGLPPHGRSRCRGREAAVLGAFAARARRLMCACPAAGAHVHREVRPHLPVLSPQSAPCLSAVSVRGCP